MFEPADTPTTAPTTTAACNLSHHRSYIQGLSEKMTSRPWEYPDFADYLRVVDPPLPKPFKWHDYFVPHLTQISHRLYNFSERTATAEKRLETLSKARRVSEMPARASEMPAQTRSWWTGLFWSTPDKVTFEDRIVINCVHTHLVDLGLSTRVHRLQTGAAGARHQGTLGGWKLQDFRIAQNWKGERVFSGVLAPQRTSRLQAPDFEKVVKDFIKTLPSDDTP